MTSWSTYGWTALLVAVLLHAINWWLCATLGFAALAAAAGFLCSVCWRNLNAAEQLSLQICRSRLPLPCAGIPGLVRQMRAPPAAELLRLDARYTGSSPIDHQLRQVLQFAFRDYVKVWYREVSDDGEFLHALHALVQTFAVRLAGRAKDVDWVPFITGRVVDDVVLHLRLFRRARSRLAAGSSDSSSNSSTPASLETAFFELEASEDRRKLCREAACTDPEYQRQYLRDLARLLVHKLLPQNESSCGVLQAAAVELLSQMALLPLVELLSSPDYINRLIVWLSSETPLASDSFLAVLRLTHQQDELLAVRQTLMSEIRMLRSRDTGGEQNEEVKDQMSSLMYVDKVIEHRLRKLREGSIGGESQVDGAKGTSQNFFSLPLDVVLKNNVALSYFLDFLATIGEQHLLFFYLNVEGWRISVEQQLSERGSLDRIRADRLREAAQSVYDQALSEVAQTPVKLDDLVARRLAYRIQNEQRISETWFDEAQTSVIARFAEDRMYPAFRRTPAYPRLLAELDLLRDPDEDSQSTCSEDGVSLLDDPIESARDLAAVRRLDTEILIGALAKEGGKSYTVYSVIVTVINADRSEDIWTVLRRYSDFHDFHEKVMDRYPRLSHLPFPGKRAFNNQSQTFVERRRAALNGFMKMLLRPNRLAENTGLLALSLAFLESGQYRRDRGGLERAVESVVTPLRVSLRAVSGAVRAAPDSLLQTVDDVVGGLSRVIRGGPTTAGSRQPSPLPDLDAEDSPLRIVLLLLEEVFDLRSRNQWLRRRIVAILRQIIKTMYGDSMSRRIVDYLAELTGPEQVAGYVRVFKNTQWPGGSEPQPATERDELLRMRTRLVARACMLSNVSDELRHILGSETSRSGVFLVFELVQNPVLNSRLVFVVLEGLLELLLPDCDVLRYVTRLHARSHRPAENSTNNRI